jgi:hypothetical protein
MVTARPICRSRAPAFCTHDPAGSGRSKRAFWRGWCEPFVDARTQPTGIAAKLVDIATADPNQKVRRDASFALSARGALSPETKLFDAAFSVTDGELHLDDF